MDFAERLLRLRQMAGLSQAELARRAGLRASAINHWEKGIRSPTWDAVQALAKALNVSCLAFSENEPLPASLPPAEPGPKRGRPPAKSDN